VTLPFPPPLPLPATSPRVLDASDFVRPGEPSLAQWVRASNELRAEGRSVASELAAGRSAAGYFELVNERARKIAATKPLPLPPRPPLPMPPMLSLPMPPRPPLPFPPRA